MDNNMGTMIILGVEPEFIPSGMMKGQIIILQIVFTKGNTYSGRGYRLRETGTLILLLFLFAGILFVDISSADQFAAYLFRCREIGDL